MSSSQQNTSNTHGEHVHEALVDSSTGVSGVMVEDIIDEEQNGQGSGETQRLTNTTTKNYGTSVTDQDTSPAKKKDYDGYALSRAEFLPVVTTIYMCAFLSALDGTVVSTLLTRIASDLNAVADMSWIATAYLLSSAAFQPLYGKLSDIFGRKAILLFCVIMFGIGCCISSFKSLYMVVFGRFITGIGGSGLTSVGTITLSDLIPLRDRGVYQGAANIAFLLGAASGGIIGGIINDTLGWTYVFILQIPVTVIIWFALYFNLNLPEGSAGLGDHGNMKLKLKRIDFLGSFCLVIALIIILLAASLGDQYFTYTSPTFFVLCGLCLMFLALFVYVETYVSPEPIIPIELIGHRTILASSVSIWFYTMTAFTYIYYYPIYLSSVIGLSSTQVGLRIIANFFGVAIGSFGSGIFMKKTGKYYKLAVVSGIIIILGNANFNLMKPSIPSSAQLVLMFFPGLGYAVMLTITLLALIAAVPVKMQAATTSIQYTFRSTGSTLGISVASAIFHSILKSRLFEDIPKVVNDADKAKDIINNAMDNTYYSRQVPEKIGNVIIGCYEVANKGAFKFSLTCAVIGAIASLFMREHKLHTSVDRD